MAVAYAGYVGSATASAAGAGGTVATNTTAQATGSAALADSTSFTPAVGEIIVVKATASVYVCTPTSISNTGASISWTTLATYGTSGTTTVITIFVGAVNTSAASTISVTYNNTYGATQYAGFVVERYTGAGMPSNVAGTNTMNANTATTLTSTITTQVANSMVSWIASDYAGVISTNSYTTSSSTATQTFQNATAGTLCFYGAYRSTTTPGSTTYGYTVSAAGPTDIFGAVEIPPVGNRPVAVLGMRPAVVTASIYY